MKTRAKEVVMEKSAAAKDRFLSSPTALGVASGLATMGIASLILRRRRRAREEAEYFDDIDMSEVALEGDVGGVAAESYVQAPPATETYVGPPPGTTAFEDEQPGKLAAAKEKARDLGQRASDAACAATRSVKHAAQGAGRKVESTATDWPLLFAAGAAAAGAVIALLVPAGEKERELLGPIRRRTRGQIDTLRAKIDEELDTLQDKVERKIDTLSSPPPTTDTV